MASGLKGAENCRDSVKLQSLLKEQREAGRWIASICASPALVLEHHGLLKGVKACCYPSFLNKLSNPCDSRVCVDQKISESPLPEQRGRNLAASSWERQTETEFLTRRHECAVQLLRWGREAPSSLRLKSSAVLLAKNAGTS